MITQAIQQIGVLPLLGFVASGFGAAVLIFCLWITYLKAGSR